MDIQQSNLTIEEIDTKIIQLKKELLELKIRKMTKQTTKPHILKKIKNQISQMLTLKTKYLSNKL